MKIKSEILEIIDNPSTRTRIAIDLGVGEQVIAGHMRRNLPNSRLTKMDALMSISKYTDVPVDQILEEDTITEGSVNVGQQS